MLFTHRGLDETEASVLERISALRDRLRNAVVLAPRRWTGLLARMTRARALRASNSIEGIHVTREDALAAIDGAEATSADRPTWRAIEGYRSAMGYVLQRGRDPGMRFSADLILSVHYMITESDLAANPGNWRPGWVGVRNTATGELVHEGVDRDRLEPLVAELVDYMNARGAGDPILRAAMTHLNLAMLHPFSDGNGRTARCLQSAVLCHDGIAAPEFSSIEEYVGFNQQRYYEVLGEVGGGGWNPERSVKPWIRFCLTGHYQQAQRILQRADEYGRVYEELVFLVQARALHERTALGLLSAAVGERLKNASYCATTEVSPNVASRDLKALVDAGLLVAQGEKRGRAYIAGPDLIAMRNRLRGSRRVEDPFAERVSLAQEPLFGR